MAYRDHEIGAKVRSEPAVAAALLVDLLREADGFVAVAARNLGVAINTVSRWLAALKLQGYDVRQMADAPPRLFRPSPNRGRKPGFSPGKRADREKKTRRRKKEVAS